MQSKYDVGLVNCPPSAEDQEQQRLQEKEAQKVYVVNSPWEGVHTNRVSQNRPRKQAVPITTPESTTRYSSSALENEAQLKGGTGVFWELTVVVTSSVASARFLHFYDTADALSAGATPFFRLPIPAGPASVTFTPVGGRSFIKGLRVATSTTLATFTDPGDLQATFHADMD